MPRRLSARRLFACFVAVASVTGVFTAFSSATAIAATDTGLSAWRACGGKLQCATLTVPVDYSQPDGEQVDLAVAPLRAPRPHQRPGSPVVNFRGPGDPGTRGPPGYAPPNPAPG